ncbi:MAG: peptidoglycan-binding protein [Granulosicoccus sp.]|nr:peptidoglycan-binding protein [Granulosicoccus sp.]
MRNLILALFGSLASGFLASASLAEQIDNTQTLPDAKPGECYAKVITPPVFETKTEEVVLQEASERVEAVEAEYESTEQAVVVKEASELLEVTDAVFETETENLEIRAAETGWTSELNGQRIPVDSGTLELVAKSGIELEKAEAGSCFVEYFTDTQYTTETEEVLVKEAYEVITVVPPEYEEVEERILIKEASKEVVDVPAVYRTETESVLVEPARSAWREGCGIVEKVDNSTGETMCLVTIPARYETLTKTVLDKPATTETVTVPAVYETIMVQKLVNPAAEQREQIPAEYTTVSKRIKSAEPTFFWLAKGTDAADNANPTGREICLTESPAEFATINREVVASAANVKAEAVPATFESVEVQRLVKPATERRIVIPARTKSVVSQQQVEPSKLEWRKVLCEINMTPKTITAIQLALQREGYNPGPVDGIIGRTTMEAMEQFQVDQGIDRRGLTYEALQLLKVEP